ncbi:MAG: siderophore-interacting protein [Acidimicrobiia bacterium]
MVVRPLPIGDASAARGCVRVSVTATRRLRREPPAFRHVEVRRVERLTPRLVRVTFGGAELAGFTVDQPAASVRVLLPSYLG